jgi:hypothetical protein
VVYRARVRRGGRKRPVHKVGYHALVGHTCMPCPLP